MNGKYEETRFTYRDGSVTIDRYDDMPAFSSFLPGLSGVHGIPVWAYYSNRAQAIGSIGIHHKGDCMLEFHPANIAYEKTAQEGFRTFLRVSGDVFEPFSPLSDERRRMTVEPNALIIEEENPRRGLNMRVEYATLPDSPLGALMRRVEVKNVSGEPIFVEMLDGLPRVIPYGLQLGAFREMANLFKSWADVDNLENRAPMYKLRSTTDDSSRVDEITGAFFICCASGGELLPILVDAETVFGSDTSLSVPRAFKRDGLEKTVGGFSCALNRIACGFACASRALAPNESLVIDGYYGFTPSADILNSRLDSLSSESYASSMRRRAREIAASLLKDVRARTAFNVFDGYIEQCYLDNFLRGGYAARVGGRVMHLYSRKHGDPERDYNWFTLAGEHYSQGNGNFRDVCQNRRLDVYTHPYVGDANVHMFFSLVQADGFNPLEIRPTKFALPADSDKAASLLEKALGDYSPIQNTLSGSFTPGTLMTAVAKANIALKIPEDEFIDELLALCEPSIEAVYGEGYWSDHFDYLLDLIEDYLRVYPDKSRELLIERRDYAFFDGGAYVKPICECARVTDRGVRMYDAVDASGAKNCASWLVNARGETVYTNLFGKLLTLIFNKAALLDPDGLGVSMSGGRPGWNDAMNGLPGLFGSGMPETLELDRLLAFVLNLKEGNADVPAELYAFMKALNNALEPDAPIARWELSTNAVEAYRASVRGSVSGETHNITLAEALPCLLLIKKRVSEGISRALEIGGGVMPTYFTYEVTDYLPLETEPFVRPKAFARSSVPAFLEGPARYLSSPMAKNGAAAEEMVAKVRQSDLYDSPLGMYKTSAPIDDMSIELGRVRAFTPGWLERESVFLHMEYKYLLGLLKAGFCDEFYLSAFRALIPFLDPNVYGRSTFENCSFIASSCNPDPRVRGRGFVARLSGSTAEMLSIWQHMTIGDGGYVYENGNLGFRFEPRLSGEFFTDGGEMSFTLHGLCEVVYKNPSRGNTYGENGVSPSAISYSLGGSAVEVKGDTLPDGRALRNGEIKRIVILLSQANHRG